MEPHRDLDAFGWAVMNGDLVELKRMYSDNQNKHYCESDNDEAARVAAVQQIYFKRWGPTRVPVYNLLLLSRLINEKKRPQHIEVAKWLIEDVQVPVDAKDLSGSTAMNHAISTKPSFDPEYAQLLYDAGADVNHRNRYGATPAHEITMTWELGNKAVVRRVATALKWFLDYGGNIDVLDSDGMTARQNVESTKHAMRGGARMETWKVGHDEDQRRKKLGKEICAFCGRPPRAGVRLLVCSKCKGVRYCSSGLPCQKGDWPRHKGSCKKDAA
ncbi:hypothetical protein C8Q80DRAFT_1166378 [Daedaleopsis nitida]|nr:hypothetical protein C8Q80DRAFT_1166378 [Daedaleopsis nitida]